MRSPPGILPDRVQKHAHDDPPPAQKPKSASVEQQLVEAVEAERRRLGRDFHDGLGQRLTSMALVAAILHQKLEMAQRPEASDARRLVAQIDETVREARSLIRGLYPASLALNGLEKTVDELLQRVQDVSGCRARVILDSWEPVTEPLDAMQIYRIVQEAVNNAVKHSGCSTITVRFELRGNRCRVTIDDDGGGIAEGVTEGMGLRLMQYRAELLGGYLTFGSPAGRGTSIELSFDRR